MARSCTICLLSQSHAAAHRTGKVNNLLDKVAINSIGYSDKLSFFSFKLFGFGRSERERNVYFVCKSLARVGMRRSQKRKQGGLKAWKCVPVWRQSIGKQHIIFEILAAAGVCRFCNCSQDVRDSSSVHQKPSLWKLRRALWKVVSMI